MANLGMLKNIKDRGGTRDSQAVWLTVKDIPVGDIRIKGNIRKDYTGIDELKESIRQHGLLQPVTVYPEEDGYAVKTGHRRFIACKSLYQEEPERFHSVRCIVSDAANVAVIQLVENVQRVDLSQIDLYNALKDLRDQGMTLRQIAEVMGKTEGYIKSLFVGVNEISKDETLPGLIGDAGITIRDIAETAGIEDKQERLNLLEQRKAGTVNRAEMRQKVRELKTGKPETPPPPNIDEPNDNTRLRRYAVKTRFTFEGSFFVQTESRKNAKELVESQCGLVLGGNIHTSLNKSVLDWEFPVHPQKAVTGVKPAR